MEFSEPFELKNLAKSRNPRSTTSPLKSITKYQSTNLGNLVNDARSYIKEYSSLKRPKHLHTNSDFSLDLVFEKDTSYLQEPKETKQSSLTLLLQQNEDSTHLYPVRYLALVVFFFRTENSVKIFVPPEINTADTIIKALLAYDKTNYPKLPHGLDSQGYDLWIADEDCLPDNDYILDPMKSISSLAVNTFCLCEKPEYRSSIYNSNTESKKMIKHSNPGTIYIKFFFEYSSTFVAVNPEHTLSEVLIVLWKKFFIFGDLNQELFELRVFVKEIGNECALDMNLKIKELPNVDIRLYRKVLADAPRPVHRKVRSQFNFREYNLC